MNALRTQKRSGFTLIELMVALGIMGIVMVLVAQAFTAQQKAYFAIDDISETQQNSSIVQTVIDSELRHAGFMVPTAAAVCAIDNWGSSGVGNVGSAQVQLNTDILWVSSSGLDVIDPISTLLTRKAKNGEPLISTDLGARLSGTYVNTPGTKTLLVDSLSIDEPAATSPTSDFVRSQGVILVREDSQSVLACGQIIGTVTGNVIPVQLFAVSSVDNPGDGSVLVVPASLYYIAPPSSTNGNQPTLMRDGVAFVPGIEDLQVAFFVDRNANRLVDAGEYLGAKGAAWYNFFDTLNAGYVVVNQLREVRVTAVSRSLSQSTDQESKASGHAQSIENHIVGGGPDRFLRRVVTTTAWIRNVAERI